MANTGVATRGRRRASAAIMAELREMLSGDILREIIELEDHGEVVLTVVGAADGGDPNLPHNDGRDVWTDALEPLENDRPHRSRLYVPAGILFSAPNKGATAHILRPKSRHGTNSPGFGLLIPDGGDGSKSFLPSWWGNSDDGLYTQGRNLRVHAKDKDVIIQAGDATITVRGGNGKVEITAKSGADVVINGGSLKAARVSDPLAVGTLTGQAGPFPVVFAYVPMTSAAGVDVPGVPQAGPTVNLGGIISNGGGAPNVKE